jgi:uncharacterized protein YndB with AHSA1/START domain
MSQATTEISMSIAIYAPAEAVWQALTEQDALRAWFNDTLTIDPSDGGRIEFSGTNGNEVYRCTGRLTTWQPQRHLTAEINWDPPGLPQPTLLSLDIEPGDTDEVIVTLRHHGWERIAEEQRESLLQHFQQVWDGDELIPLKEYVEGVGPSY